MRQEDPRSTAARAIVAIGVLVPILLMAQDAGFTVAPNWCGTWTEPGGTRHYYLDAAESLHANWMTVHVGDFGGWPDSVADFVNLAGEKGLRVALAGVPIGEAVAGNPWATIADVSAGVSHVHEETELNLEGDIGERVPDGGTTNGYTWAVGQQSGWFQTDTIGVWNLDTQNIYTAVFRLKADTTGWGSQPLAPVCSLIVSDLYWNDTTHSFLQESVVARCVIPCESFPDAQGYQEFEREFYRVARSAARCRLRVFSCSTVVSLRADNVKLYDAYADGLLRGPNSQGPLWAKVRDTARAYQYQAPGVFRFMLKDEPTRDQMESWTATKEAIRQGTGGNATGLSWVALDIQSDQGYYRDFVQACRPAELFADAYPLYGRTYKSDSTQTSEPGRVPVDSGERFQAYLDTMCLVLDSARAAARSVSPEIPFWFDVQAFCEAMTNSDFDYDTAWNHRPATGDSELIWREPTPRELRCMTWLALASGAKGITYWLFLTTPGVWPYLPAPTQKRFYLLGLVGFNRTSDVYPYGYPEGHRPLFDTVRVQDSVLRAIGPTLRQLNSTAVGRSDGLPVGFITKAPGVSRSPLQFGTFIGPKGHYFIVVNRHCLKDSIRFDTVGVSLAVPAGASLFLHDEVTGEEIVPCRASPDTVFFPLRLEPGQGRLLRVVSFAGGLERNQGENFANLLPVALHPLTDGVYSSGDAT